MKYISRNLEETQKIAKDFIKTLASKENEAMVVGLYGDLGSGKTTFTQNIAKVFGVGDTVTSPTFVIMKVYELRDQRQETREDFSKLLSLNSSFYHLIHIDAYRLEKSKELLHLGWNDIISNKENLVVVEWPERVADIMPKHIKIYLKHTKDEGSRQIEMMV